MRKSRNLPLIILLIGTAISIGLASLVAQSNNRQYETRLNVEMEAYMSDIEQVANGHLQQLTSLAHFVEASDDISSDEFSKFSQYLLAENPGLLSTGWTEIVENNAPEAHKYPMTFFETQDGMASYQGFDQSASAKARDAIKISINRGIQSATTNVEARRGNEIISGIIVYEAVFDAEGNAKGLASILIRTGYTVETAIAEDLEHIQVRVDDMRGKVELVNLVDRTVDGWLGLENYSYARTINLANVPFRFELIPDDYILKTKRPPFPWLVLCIGIVSTLLFTQTVLFQQRQRASVERLVKLRTRALKHSNEDLRKANEDLEKFAYAASHDLKSPLRAIDNLVTWMSEDLENVLDAENLERLDQVKSRIQRMERLLFDLLSYARIGKSETSKDIVDLHDLATQVINLLYIPEGFTVHVDESLRGFDVPKMPLKQIIQNLINNAVKHHDRNDGIIQICLTETVSSLNISVTDDGPGIDGQFHEKIFEMFQTIKRRDEVESSGMGLAIINKLAKSVGARVAVKSSLGKGAEFTIIWPKDHTNVTPQKEKAA